MQVFTEVVPHDVLEAVSCSAKFQGEGTVNWVSALSGDPTVILADPYNLEELDNPKLDIKQAQSTDPVTVTGPVNSVQCLSAGVASKNVLLQDVTCDRLHGDPSSHEAP